MIVRFDRGRELRYCLLALAVGSLGGCQQPTESERMNAPPQGAGQSHPLWTELYAYHNDQGMMADRSIADIHFVPGSTDLSGTGVARMERYAELLATTGGTLWYGPSIQDKELIEARIATAKAFLAQALPGAKTIHVALGLGQGRGMSAAEAKTGKTVANTAEARGTAYSLAGEGGGKGK